MSIRRKIVQLKKVPGKGALSTGRNNKGKASTFVNPLNKRKAVYEAADAKKGKCDSPGLVDIFLYSNPRPPKRIQNPLIIILLIVLLFFIYHHHMDQKTKIEYSIKTSELKSPGRHFKFTYSSTDYNHPTNSVLSPK